MPEIRRMRPLLGTFVEIAVEEGSSDAGEEAIAASFRAIEKIQSLLSFHDSHSELSLLNRAAYRSAVSVHPWTWRVLGMCRRLHMASRGIFDPSVALRLVENGLLPAPIGSGDSPEHSACFSDVEMTGGRKIRFLKPLWLDLGGIAKGFAVDVAILTLRAHGVRQAHVNAGGDMRAMGGKPIPVWLRDPDMPSRTVPVGMLHNAACATSGGYFNAQHGWAIMTPQTSEQPRVSSVTVLARRCMVADALTKIVALMGAAESEPILEQFEATAFTGIPQ